MSEPKHTPGPWRLSSDSYILGRLGEPIATTRTKGLEKPLPNFIANGFLIAAAPELLSAAKAVDAVTLMIDRGFATVSDLCHIMKQLQAAIAKAEGK